MDVGTLDQCRDLQLVTKLTLFLSFSLSIFLFVHFYCYLSFILLFASFPESFSFLSLSFVGVSFSFSVPLYLSTCLSAFSAFSVFSLFSFFLWGIISHFCCTLPLFQSFLSFLSLPFVFLVILSLFVFLRPFHYLSLLVSLSFSLYLSCPFILCCFVHVVELQWLFPALIPLTTLNVLK